VEQHANASAVGHRDDGIDFEDQVYLKHFVEQYLTSRGYSVTARNARVVVAAIASCRAEVLDGPALEACVDRALNPELLRPAA
jgi:hypothetical protein